MLSTATNVVQKDSFISKIREKLPQFFKDDYVYVLCMLK